VLFQQMRTQTAEYWLEEFAIHKEDVEYLYEWFVEEGEPRTIDELGLKVVERHCLGEEDALSKKSDRGLIYQPQQKYAVGQRLVFPAFEYAVGKVLAVREGNNPRYGPFGVIQVQLENGAAPREFAAEFALDHALNRSMALLKGSEGFLSPEQLYKDHGPSVRKRLQDALLQNEDFVHFDRHWFLRELLLEVSPFHLNIAEAMIDERHQPLTISQLLEEVELPSETKISVRAYALGYALSQDPRFVEISVSDAPTWYLNSLIPTSVHHKPARLVPMYSARGGEWLNRELRDFVTELADEADELEQPRVVKPGSVDSVQILLIYPHRREGTLPLPTWALGLLLEKPAEPLRVTFLDQQNKEKIACWMMPAEGYAWGLGEWYQRHGVPIGGVVELRQADDPVTFLISHEKRRRKGDWIREAKVFRGRLTFSIQRKAYACHYDKHLLIDEGPADELNGLWINAGQETQSLFEYLTEIFPELAKLSGQGLVHAKTLYSAVNLTRRCGAVPIFAELTRRACFDPVGDGNWIYDGSLRDITYNTPEQMSRRPNSHRQNLIVDRVYQYGVNSEVHSP